MPTSRGVRIVKHGHTVSGRDVDVFDLETGAKLLNVYAVDIHISREQSRCSVTTSDPVIYEGPAELVTSEEAIASREARN